MNAAVKTGEIVFERRGRIGTALLNRPKAMNALTADMCDALLAQLRAWCNDASVHAVVIRGAGEKAFCAGGDVIRLYEDGRKKGPYPRRFYWAEYRCDTAIKFYPKPFIALMDGIVMGGGVGVSIHGSHRIVSERTVFAMPETGIGLFPDVGGTYFLPRLPGKAGMYLGLTGRRMKAADCVALGLAEAFVPHEQIDELETMLAADATTDRGQISEIVSAFSQKPEGGNMRDDKSRIEQHFGGARLEAILESLSADSHPWAGKVLEELRAKAPLSLKVAFRQLTVGAEMSFLDAMRLEWRLAARFAADHDFYEGVRALLVDKDMSPQWKPASLAEVTTELVDAYFEPMPGDQLDLNGIIEER